MFNDLSNLHYYASALALDLFALDWQIFATARTNCFNEARLYWRDNGNMYLYSFNENQMCVLKLNTRLFYEMQCKTVKTCFCTNHANGLHCLHRHRQECISLN